VRAKLIVNLILFPLFIPTMLIQAATFEFLVKHEHAVGSCRGKLILNDREILYKASDEEHSLRWPYLDIQRLDIASPTQITFKTYTSEGWKKLGKDKAYQFHLIEGELTTDVQEFLRSKLSRPMVARLVTAPQADPVLLHVRHRHRLGGCEGQLEIAKDRLTYSSDRAGDNRVWKFNEIVTFGSPDPYHLRLTTYNETFTFDLKAPLESKVYDILWAKINRLEAAQRTKE
jgi:hypothetical protein